MKKILITCTDVMMYQFILPHVLFLSKCGYLVDIACSHAEGYKNEGYHEYIKKNIPNLSKFYSVNLERNPFDFRNIKGLHELKRIVNTTHYDLIWTNEPVMGVITRLAARRSRKNGTIVLYLSHGYHFFRGAPLINWVAYPIEKIMSFCCDVICLICWEDYYFTKKHIKRKNVYHIDGIGFDIDKYSNVNTNRDQKRKLLGIKEEDILVLSVGELQSRKNHEPIIRAIGKIENQNIIYMICGRGELQNHLYKVAKEVGIADRLILMGHIYDIPEVLKAADIFAHPSLREGLGIAALEAMASGLPLITSNVQGIKDYMKNGETGFVFEPNDIDGYAQALKSLIEDKKLRERIGKHNIEVVKKYDISKATVSIFKIISALC